MRPLERGRALGDAALQVVVEAAQRGPARLERLVGRDLPGDVRVDAEPADDLAVRGAHRLDAGQERSEPAVGAAQRKRHLERRALGDGAPPILRDPGQDLRIVDVLPAPPFHLLGRGAAVLVPAPIVPDDVAVAVGQPAQGRNVVGEQLERRVVQRGRRQFVRGVRARRDRAPIALAEILAVAADCQYDLRRVSARSSASGVFPAWFPKPAQAQSKADARRVRCRVEQICGAQPARATTSRRRIWPAS